MAQQKTGKTTLKGRASSATAQKPSTPHKEEVSMADVLTAINGLGEKVLNFEERFSNVENRLEGMESRPIGGRPAKTYENYEDIVQKLESFGQQYEQLPANLRRGLMATGLAIRQAANDVEGFEDAFAEAYQRVWGEASIDSKTEETTEE